MFVFLCFDFFCGLFRVFLLIFFQNLKLFNFFDNDCFNSVISRKAHARLHGNAGVGVLAGTQQAEDGLLLAGEVSQ